MTPFDKPMTALIVEVKTKNCPEAPTAHSLIGGIGVKPDGPGMNFVDGDN
jgi:hypothetical protein